MCAYLWPQLLPGWTPVRWLSQGYGLPLILYSTVQLARLMLKWLKTDRTTAAVAQEVFVCIIDPSAQHLN